MFKFFSKKIIVSIIILLKENFLKYFFNFKCFILFFNPINIKFK